MGIDVAVGPLWRDLGPWSDDALSELLSPERFVPFGQPYRGRALGWADRVPEDALDWSRVEVGLRACATVQRILSALEGRDVAWDERAPERPQDAFDEIEAFETAADGEGVYVGRWDPVGHEELLNLAVRLSETGPVPDDFLSGVAPVEQERLIAALQGTNRNTLALGVGVVFVPCELARTYRWALGTVGSAPALERELVALCAFVGTTPASIATARYPQDERAPVFHNVALLADAVHRSRESGLPICIG
jgi:hypothetical protein